MNKISILILGILVASIGIANQSFAQRTCGTDAAWAQVVADNPKYATSRIALEQSIQQWIQNNPGGNNASKVVYTIPVVVHVVYNTSSQNISDAQVLSQIDVLNEDQYAVYQQLSEGQRVQRENRRREFLPPVN